MRTTKADSNDETIGEPGRLCPDPQTATTDAPEAIDRELALRIGLCARALPGITVEALLEALVTRLGAPLTGDRMTELDTQQWHLLCADLSVPPDRQTIADAYRVLSNPPGTPAPMPSPEAFTSSDWPESLRVACASNQTDIVDGHFGSCLRFLIYQVSAQRIALIDVRHNPVRASGTRQHRPGEDPGQSTVTRVAAIKDCALLFVQSIGGPAAARVVNAGIHPIKLRAPGPAPQVLEQLQARLQDQPPPWLAAAAHRPARPFPSLEPPAPPPLSTGAEDRSPSVAEAEPTQPSRGPVNV